MEPLPKLQWPVLIWRVAYFGQYPRRGTGLQAALTDETLDGVIGGGLFGDIFRTGLNIGVAGHGAGTVGIYLGSGMIGMAASTAANAAVSFAKHFKFS